MSDDIDLQPSIKSCTGGFEGLRRLLAGEEEDLLILEERCLLHDANILIKKQKALFRLFGGKNESLIPRKPGRRSATKRLPDSIDPEDLYKRLISSMENERYYLEEDITLASLANALDIEPHQLTFFLNRSMHMKFHDFINQYRIKAAKEHLRTEPEEGILSIAFKAGFNSKASFNRVFKKITGKTPTQYRITLDKGVAES